jgi:hypothetical protein
MAIDTFLKRTGQLPTFWMGVLTQGLGAGLVVLALTPIGTEGSVTTFTVLLLGGFVLGLGGFAWNCLVIRCPSCGSRVFWDATRRGSFASWLSGNIGGSCPSCGYSAPSREHKRNT